MKSNKITHTIAFFIIGLFTFVSSQAQEANTLFINVPDSLCPLLTKVNREDCIDFLSSKMKAQVEKAYILNEAVHSDHCPAVIEVS